MAGRLLAPDRYYIRPGANHNATRVASQPQSLQLHLLLFHDAYTRCLSRFMRASRRCSLHAASFCTEGNGGSPIVLGTEWKPPRRRRAAPQ